MYLNASAFTSFSSRPDFFPSANIAFISRASCTVRRPRRRRHRQRARRISSTSCPRRSAHASAATTAVRAGVALRESQGGDAWTSFRLLACVLYFTLREPNEERRFSVADQARAELRERRAA